MEIDKLPVKWLQSSFQPPLKIFVSDITSNDGRIVFLEDGCPFIFKDDEIYDSCEDAEKALNEKIDKINSVKELVKNYISYGMNNEGDEDVDENWLVEYIKKKTQTDSSFVKSLEKINNTYGKIIQAYRTGVINTDAISFRIKDVVTAKFGRCYVSKTTGDTELRVALVMNTGKIERITLKDSEGDMIVFKEFFGENNSGYFYQDI